MTSGSTRGASQSTVSATVSSMQPGSGSTASFIGREQDRNALVSSANASSAAVSSSAVHGSRQPSGNVEMLPYAASSASSSSSTTAQSIVYLRRLGSVQRGLYTDSFTT